MDIEQFFAQCEGTWFSQRSFYQLETQQMDNGKADLTVARLAASEPSVAQLGDRAGIAASDLGGGLQMNWDTAKQDWNRPQQAGSVLLAIAPEGGQTGRLARLVGEEVAVGRYQIKADDSLILTVALPGDRQLEERLWFASENLRLRISTLRAGSTYQAVTFYSEIRRLSPS